MAAGWSILLVSEAGGPHFAQTISNVGLIAAAWGASLGCVFAARRNRRYRRTWILLAISAFSWGFGQVLWTWYESVLGRELPFPSLADVGYLAAVPLAVAGLMLLPSASVGVAGTIRTILDGMMVAGSLLLTSWVIVLDSVWQAGGDDAASLMISLAYPLGDVVLVTIVIYVALRQRGAGSSFPLRMIGAGLVAIAIADSGFAYLTATGAYSSGNLIDIGWFVGYTLVLVASFRPTIQDGLEADGQGEHQFRGALLPYAAVCMALMTSSIELLRSGSTDSIISWIRTFIIAAMVMRQILTLLENRSLTQHLEARVVELRESEQRFEALVQHSSDVVTVIDIDGRVRYQSESVDRVFGYAADTLLGKPVFDLLDDASREQLTAAIAELADQPYGVRVLELQVQHRSGGLCEAEMTVTNLLANPSVDGLVLNTRDISERKTLEDKLVYSAFHDPLTALANRALFRQRVEHTLSRRSRDKVGVLFVDLDGFKQVNDLMGHASGDTLLVQFAERLRALVRPEDTVARLGGDEFAVLLDDGDPGIAAEVAQRITDGLREPFRIDDQEMYVRGSIGIAIAGPDVGDADRLLRNADLAMYRAKADGGGAYKRYDPDMHVDLVERLQLEADLRRAIEAGELVMHYQPSVKLSTGEIEGAEGLVRWQHPTRGLVPPEHFIPLAEESGLIIPVGRWVLGEVCRQAVEWSRSHPALPLTMSVNISGRQLRPDFVGEVEAILRESGLDPRYLVLEMTESVLMDHTEENLELFGELKERGVGLAIDDFGTGYSSLSYLHRFPVDILKIDQSFIDGLGDSEDDTELVRTIVRLGQSLRMKTIAEGIEDQQQVAALLEIDCDLGQGYHYARPLPAEQFVALLDRSVGAKKSRKRERRWPFLFDPASSAA